MQKIQVVVGAQYGSEGKGAVCGHLAAHADPDATFLGIRVGGSQAGHTVVGDDGVAWPLRHVPVAAVARPDSQLYIAPGSELDLDVLFDEIQRLDAAGYNVSRRLMISGQATIITAAHKATEAARDLTGKLGSTAKGVGAARADRIMRDAPLANQIAELDWYIAEPEDIYSSYDILQIEGVQGFALGLHAGYYPYCTSADARVIDFLAMAGVTDPWNRSIEPWMAIRPNPIRVAGHSGPMHGETTWEALGLPAEKTTVTRKVRRVGAWDGDLVARAAAANGGTVYGALTMADHLAPELAGRTGEIKFSALPGSVRNIVSECMMAGAIIKLLGTGPSTMAAVVW